MLLPVPGVTPSARYQILSTYFVPEADKFQLDFQFKCWELTSVSNL